MPVKIQCLASPSVRQLTHPRLQRDRLAVDDERAVAVMVDGPCVLVLGVPPGFDHFEDEEPVFVGERRILDLAFEVDEALGDERGTDASP